MRARPPPAAVGRRQFQQHARAVAQPEAPRRSATAPGARPGAGCGRTRWLAAHELAPRRHVVEQVAHLDGGADRMRRRAPPRSTRPPSTSDLAPCSRRGARETMPQPRHRADRGQRLAAKAERGDRLQVVERGDLAGRVALDRQWQLAGARCRSHRRAPGSAPMPPRSMSISMRRGAGVEAFSISSLTTEAGRSMTSPAAIWSISSPETERGSA